jgi:hypothetical protein
MSRNFQEPDMKVTQQYFSSHRLALALLLVMSGVATDALAASRGRITPVQKGPDPILMGSSLGPCASEIFSPDFVAGMNAYGHPVAPADLPGNITAAIPSDVVVPEVFTKNRNIGRVDVPVEIPGLAEASAPPPVCARHQKG